MTGATATKQKSSERPRDPAAIAAVVTALAAAFGNRLVTSTAVREQHANTTTWVANEPPDAVVFAQSTADVQAVVRICAAHGLPVIAFGTGTSLEGQVNAPRGGVCIDMRDMNRVLAVHAEDLDCVIEPGITRKALNEQLRDQGLFFPIDPGADASLGGMTATRASGTNAVRYGTMKDNVLALKAVLATGEVIKTAQRAKKSAAGYDLTRLFVGSEGTLGVITEITLKLHGIPESIAGGVCPFPSVEAACNATIATIQTGIPVARIELLDELQVKACNAYSKLDLPESGTDFGLVETGCDAPGIELEQLAGETEKFPSGQFVVEKWKIGNVGDFAPRFERLRLHVEAADARAAGSRLHQTGENFQRRGFAGGVRSEHGEKLPARNRERHVVDRDEIAKFFYDIDKFDHRFGFKICSIRRA